jgi:hypothetical protein
MGRWIVWSLALLFCYFCIQLIISVFLLQSEMRKLEESIPREGGGNVIVFRHDTYCTISPIPGIRMPLHTHGWAAIVLSIGLGLVVLALVFLLHVPVKDPV